MAWTFKILAESEDGSPDWAIAKLRYNTSAEAATGAAAYLREEAECGRLMVVALEPIGDRVLFEEHAGMLDYLKEVYTNARIDGVWEIIHTIDPSWPNPWGNE